ncbi:MAG: hypothetical protein AB7V77_03515 [Candidatus Woesearchaeota archaeon]
MQNKIINNGNRGLYIAIFVLAILLIATIGYISYAKIKENKLAKDKALIDQGILLGQENAVVTMMNLATQCTPIPVSYNNVTINFFPLECNNLAEVASAVLQQRAAAQQNE